jgi:hypothetical protein
MRRFAFALLVTSLVTLAACDDKKPTDDRKSVIEGGKAESAPGKQLEKAKQDIDGVEQQLQDRADEQFEKSAGEQAGRGVP